jgi:hypothetical protein
MTNILKQIDSALEKVKASDTPTTDAVLTELTRSSGSGKRSFPLELLRDGRPVEFSPQTIMSITAQAEGEPVVSAADLEQLGLIQTEMESVLTEMGKWSLSNVQPYMHAERDRITKLALEGKELPPISVASRDSLCKAFRERQGALTAVLVNITHTKLVPIAGPILERFADTLINFARYREIGDRQVCQDYGLPYMPSGLLQAAHRIMQNYVPAQNLLPKPTAWTTPKTLLSGLVEF